jgi:hypothetical protein
MNRKMDQDHWDTIIAIKHNNFNEFWRERCDNDYDLSVAQKYGVLSNLALETFDRSDWRQLKECMDRSLDFKFTPNGLEIKREKILTLQEILDSYISTFTCMRMVYPD